MIHDFNIYYKKCNIQFHLNTPTDDDNVPYNLAEVFIRIIEDSNANPDIVIEELIENFGYKEEYEKDV